MFGSTAKKLFSPTVNCDKKQKKFKQEETILLGKHFYCCRLFSKFPFGRNTGKSLKHESMFLFSASNERPQQLLPVLLCEHSATNPQCYLGTSRDLRKVSQLNDL